MHHVSAVIGTAQPIDELRLRLGTVRIVALPQSMWLLPVTTEVLRAAGAGENIRGLRDATTALVRVLEAASTGGPLVYVETEYFGGAGHQAAMVVRDGQCASMASTDEEAPIGDDAKPISTALRTIGVERGAAYDEFDAIGLGRFRSTEQWNAHSD